MKHCHSLNGGDRRVGVEELEQVLPSFKSLIMVSIIGNKLNQEQAGAFMKILESGDII